MTASTPPIKVLHVLNYYTPHISGLTEYARLVAESLPAAGYEVTVLAHRHLASLPREEVVGGVRVVRAEPLLHLHKGVLSGQFLRLYRRLVKDQAVVHLHLPMLEAGILARLTPSSVPLIVSYQCDLAPSQEWSLLDRAAVAAVRLSSRMACHRAARILVTSKDYAVGSPVIGDFSKKWVEVHPPDKAPLGAPLRRTRLSGPQTVGFLGRFVEEKGIHVILDAIPRILERQPETRFILAGDYESVPGGSQLSRLQGKLHALGNRVSTPGKLPEEELFDFYRSLDLFLLPSINAYEAFGIVQIEAMKAGVPVIASDMRGVREPVRLTGCGSIVPPGDAVALADAVVEWLSGARSLTPEEVASRAWAAFSNRIATERVCAMYREVLSGS